MLGKDKVAFAVGDRELISTPFLEWLVREKISFRLRVRCNMQITNGKQTFVAAGRYFAPRKCLVGFFVVVHLARSNDSLANVCV